jgi:sodium-dependent dicarboxylate transporter 2/3/5
LKTQVTTKGQFMEETSEEAGRGGGLFSNLAIIGGLVASILFLLFVDLEPGHPAVTRTAAVALLMAIWWITEAVPLAITSLLPLILFPTLGIMSGNVVAPLYINNIIFLFIGGFLVALAMQRWGLHKRIALRILLWFGIRPRGIILGLMVAAAFMSMWISNTATTMMMLPIVFAIVLNLEEAVGKSVVRKYAIAVLLAIAYGASIGGIATLVGTPPNLAFVRILDISFAKAPDITFTTWMMLAFPISLILLIFVWCLLVVFYCPKKSKFTGIDTELFKKQYRELGPLQFEEKVVLTDFVLLALLWLSRETLKIGNITIPGWSQLFGRPDFFDDGTVAIAMSFLLFLIPAKKQGFSRIMDWHAVAKLPWGIVLLFGGGFALASAFKESGLSLWFCNRLVGAGSLHPIILIAIICFMVTFLTEMTSNTATAQMLLPILASLAVAVRMNPLLLMIPGTISCSCAFMLPVATPPNAIVFGTDRLRIWDMARTGFLINLFGVVLVTVIMYFWGQTVFGIDITQFPDWAVLK